MQKYHKLAKKDKKLTPPPEFKLIKLSALGLFTFLLTLLAASALAPVQPTNADEVLLGLQSISSAISLTTSSTVNLSLAAGSDGAVRTAQDTVTVTAGNAGYQLYISTSGDNNSLIRDGATPTSEDPTTYADLDTIPASLVTNPLSPAVLSNDTWGFAVTQSNSTSGSGSEDVIESGFDATYPTGDNSIATNKFIAVPTRGHDLLIAKRSSSASAVPTHVYYGARATSAKPSGLYKNTVVYTAIGSGTVTALASISPSRLSNLAGGTTLTITTPSNLALSSIASTSVTIGGAECTSPTPVKNDALTNITCLSPALATGWHEVIATITTTAGNVETYVVNPGIEYYAEAILTPQEAAITKIKADTTPGTLDLSTTITMQEFTNSVCAAMKTSTASTNSTKNYTIKDARDDKTYNIAKLDDGLCRMVQNLRLGSANTITLTPDNSDVSSNWETPTAETSPSVWGTTINAKHIYQQSNTEYGNLYNWYTATAGTGTSSLSSSDAPSSICPKNWKLPPNSGTGSYVNLFTVANITNSAEGSTRLRNSPYSFQYSGYYDAGVGTGPGDLGVGGGYWSRTAYSASQANNMYFHAGDVSGQSYHYKYHGYAVRCYLDPTTTAQNEALSAITADNTSENAGPLDLSSILTMQQMNSTLCSAMRLSTASANPNKYYILTDARDNKTYHIAKLDDGLCRMTTNLRFGSAGIAITATADSSDVSSSFEIPASAVVDSGTASWSSPVDAKHVYARTDEDKGNLYNWYTATAGTGTSSLTSGDAPSSLCPKNWKLPPSSGTGSYVNLTTAADITNDAAGSTKIRSLPYNFTYTGSYSEGVNNDTSRGMWWLRTASNNSAYDLYIIPTNVYNPTNAYKYFGYALRCYLST